MENGYTETLAANGSTTAYDVLGAAVVRVNGGTWGGGTLTIQYYDFTTAEWKDVVDGAFTAACNKVLSFPMGAENRLRGTLSGATGPDLDVNIQGSSPRAY